MKINRRALVRAILGLAMMVPASVVIRAADPGQLLPFSSSTPQIDDEGRGFMLIYNFYTSSPTSPGTQNTRFTMTNTYEFEGIAVHLFFVEGSSCSISDRYVCLSQSQTITFLASEQDPGTTGYLVAVTTYEDGEPSPFDFLIGDLYVKTSTGHFGNLGAEAIPSHNALYAGFLDPTLFLIALTNMPRVLAVDNIGSRADGNDTLVVINGVGGVFTTGATPVGGLFGLLFDDAEQAHSWNSFGSCQLVSSLSDNFPRTVPRFERVIPAGQTGWMKFWSTSTVNNGQFGTTADPRALLGAVFQRNSQAGNASGAFQGARNLHKLTLVSISPFQNGQEGAQAGASRFGNAVAAPEQAISTTVFVFPVFPAHCGFGGRTEAARD
jgi:hypothetical protein